MSRWPAGDGEGGAVAWGPDFPRQPSQGALEDPSPRQGTPGPLREWLDMARTSTHYCIAQLIL